MELEPRGSRRGAIGRLPGPDVGMRRSTGRSPLSPDGAEDDDLLRDSSYRFRMPSTQIAGPEHIGVVAAPSGWYRRTAE